MTHNYKKGILCGLLFLSLLGLTFYLVFHGQDPGQLRAALRQADPVPLGPAVWHSFSAVRPKIYSAGW